MATVKGVNFTIAEAPTPATMLDGGKWGGKVRVQTDTYEAASLAAGSTIKIAKIPFKSILLGISHITCDDITSAGTLSAGISSDVDKFFEAAVFTTANQRTAFGLVDGMGYQPAANTDAAKEIILTTATEIMSGTIKSEIYYSME